MKILFYTNSQLSSKSLGGIETLNLNLAKHLAKNNYEIYISAICSKKLLKDGVHFIPINYLKKNSNKYKFDIIVGSNDTSLYTYFRKAKKVLWLHNKLQIEKSLRKKVFFPINFHRPIAVFVSDYLKNRTSKFFLFKKRIVIPNFLIKDFLIKKINYKRKNIFVWSVQREKGLDNLIQIWIKRIFTKNKSTKLFIFGINKTFSTSKLNYYKSKNIYFYGRVSKTKLKKVYQDSLAMICLGYDETFCLNALEANSCGLPIITFAKTALKDYAKPNYNSFIAKNFDDIENKIFYLLSLNNNKKKKIIQNSYNHSKKYQLKFIEKKWLKFFKNI
tara:strand:+ start:7137 stop:8129 length:993 start_codon:yes stop_codon:yes gene_type:complete